MPCSTVRKQRRGEDLSKPRMEASACHGVDVQACKNVRPRSARRSCAMPPGWKLRADIVRRTDQSTFSQGPAKEKQLTKTDRTNWSLHPTIEQVNLTTNYGLCVPLTRQERWQASREGEALLGKRSIEVVRQAVSERSSVAFFLLPRSISLQLSLPLSRVHMMKVQIQPYHLFRNTASAIFVAFS